MRKEVLHIAPEQCLTGLIESLQPSSYIKGDPNPSAPRTQRMDFEAIPFDGNHFDWAICNHVLECVIDPQWALAGLYRIIKPGGRLLCQTPYAEKLKDTFESPLLTSGGERLLYYRQEDYLCLFGRNIAMIIRAAGFEGERVKHSVLLPDIDPLRYGVNQFEPFFLFRKPFH